MFITTEILAFNIINDAKFQSELAKSVCDEDLEMLAHLIAKIQHDRRGQTKTKSKRVETKIKRFENAPDKLKTYKEICHLFQSIGWRLGRFIVNQEDLFGQKITDSEGNEAALWIGVDWEILHAKSKDNGKPLSGEFEGFDDPDLDCFNALLSDNGIYLTEE